MISVFDIFKIGIGPSSSHTVGPMKAGKQFTDDLIARGLLANVTKVVVDVYGSLSLTGKGHHTDIAIIMGLAGNLPDSVDIDAIPAFIQDVNTHGRLMLANGQQEVEFPVDQCMNFHADNLSLHENGMRITALGGDKVLYTQTYYSIGGGFIVDEEHFGLSNEAPPVVPYPYKNAADLQRHCRESGLSLSGLMMQNELALHSKEQLEQHFAAVWEVMSAVLSAASPPKAYCRASCGFRVVPPPCAGCWLARTIPTATRWRWLTGSTCLPWRSTKRMPPVDAW
jgi:L-serine dehydratase